MLVPPHPTPPPEIQKVSLISSPFIFVSMQQVTSLKKMFSLKRQPKLISKSISGGNTSIEVALPFVFFFFFFTVWEIIF